MRLCVPTRVSRANGVDCEDLSMQGDELLPHWGIRHVQTRVMARQCESVCEYYRRHVCGGKARETWTCGRSCLREEEEKRARRAGSLQWMPQPSGPSAVSSPSPCKQTRWNSP